MISPHALHKPSSNISLITANRPKTRYGLTSDYTAFLFYILLKLILTKVANYTKIYYHIEFQALTLSDANITPTRNLHS